MLLNKYTFCKAVASFLIVIFKLTVLKSVELVN